MAIIADLANLHPRSTTLRLVGDRPLAIDAPDEPYAYHSNSRVEVWTTAVLEQPGAQPDGVVAERNPLQPAQVRIGIISFFRIEVIKWLQSHHRCLLVDVFASAGGFETRLYESIILPALTNAAYRDPDLKPGFERQDVVIVYGIQLPDLKPMIRTALVEMALRDAIPVEPCVVASHHKAVNWKRLGFTERVEIGGFIRSSRLPFYDRDSAFLQWLRSTRLQVMQ